MVFRPGYFCGALVLPLVEVFIALFVHDHLILPHGGDFLAAICLYCLLRSLFPWPVGRVVSTTLAIAHSVEILQYFQLLSHLGWQHSRLARIVLGSQFELADLLAYTLGAGLIGWCSVTFWPEAGFEPASASNE